MSAQKKPALPSQLQAILSKAAPKQAAPQPAQQAAPKQAAPQPAQQAAPKQAAPQPAQQAAPKQAAPQQNTLQNFITHNPFLKTFLLNHAQQAAPSPQPSPIITNGPFNFPVTPAPRPAHGTTYGTQQHTQPHKSGISPAGGILPVLYGRLKIPGLFVYLKVINNVLHAIYLLCEGEIDAVESVLINNKNYTEYTGTITLYTYTGTAGQTVCGLSAYDAAWTYPLANIAYIYIRISKNNDIQDLPNVEAVCRGKKVYDHRTGLTAYSKNTALHLADLLTNTRYGGRIAASKIDWASVDAAANRCDEIISGLKRFEFNYLFGSAASLQAAIDTVRNHFMGIVLEDNLYRIDYARPRTSVADFIEAEVYNLKILPVQSQSVVNNVTWNWTDPVTWEAVHDTLQDPSLGVNDEIHELNYDLTGCLSLSMSKRIATFLLNHGLSDLYVQFQTYNFKGLQPLDVFTLTHSLGLTSKQFYVTAIENQQAESYIITAREYDPAFFSDSVVTEPTYADTTLPTPMDTPDEASGLTLTENLLQLKDTTWISVIKMSWTASTWPFVKHYEVWAKQDAGAYVLLGITTSVSYELRAPLELSVYTIKIITVSLWNKTSAGITQNITPQGKYIVPVWKTGAALTGTEAGNMVLLRWMMPDNTEPAIDIDIKMYELKRGFTTDTWETAFYLGHINALVYNDTTCPSGTWRYFVKAEDSVGNYTATALTCDITVTLNPALGFQQQRNFDLSGSAVTSAAIFTIDNIGTDIGYPTNSYTWAQRFDTSKLWNDATQTYPMTNFPQWMVPAPASGSIVTTAVDLGASIGGEWSLNYTANKIGTGTASITPKLLLSDNNTTWTEYEAASLFNAKARYAKAKFVFASSNTNTTYYIQEPVYIILKANPKEQYGTAAVTGGAQAIIFTASFISITKVSLSPVFSNDSLDPRQAQPDNLTTAGMTIRLFDKNNAAAAGSVYWKVEGY